MLCAPSGKFTKAGLLVRLFLVLSPLFARAEEASLYTFREPHMGTEFTIRAWASTTDTEKLQASVKRAFERVEELNRTCSDYLPESELNDFARAPAGVRIEMSPDLFAVIDRSVQLARETGGAFDPTAGPVIRLWRLSKKNRSLPTGEQINRALARTGYHLLELDPLTRTVTKRSEGMLFDLGGIAKGYAADAALRVLEEDGFPRALVAASGDIVTGDPPPGEPGWRIGIETLEAGIAPAEMETVVLARRAISTSGDTRQYVELDGVRYSHIVSTRTGLGLTERIAATVIAPDATTSDSYATAVTLLGAEAGMRFIEGKKDVECRIVRLEGDEEVVTVSDGFPGD